MAQEVEVRPLRYNTVAASQTSQTLIGEVNAVRGTGVGQIGDILEYLEISPSSLSPGVVTVSDGSTTITAFAGGSSSLTDLKPFPWICGARSQNGPWKVTTGASVTVLAVGRFS